MSLTAKIRHYWNRIRLMIDSGYYPEFLRNQGVVIGKDTVIIYPSYIDGRLPYLLEIGSNVVISIYVTILTHDATSAYAGDMIKVGRVIIHDHVFIGANSTILCNVSIGPDSIVGAGSVVSGDVPPNSVYAGNPARFICSLESFIEKHKELSRRIPLIKGDNFLHPFIPDARKKILKDSVKDNFAYFCAKFPEGEGYNKIII